LKEVDDKIGVVNQIIKTRKANSSARIEESDLVMTKAPAEQEMDRQYNYRNNLELTGINSLGDEENVHELVVKIAELFIAHRGNHFIEL
jgi:hypothetical protein